MGRYLISCDLFRYVAKIGIVDFGNADLIAFSGFLIIWAQFSEVLGRKSFAIAAMIIFMAFSAGCASSRTSTEL